MAPVPPAPRTSSDIVTLETSRQGSAGLPDREWTGHRHQAGALGWLTDNNASAKSWTVLAHKTGAQVRGPEHRALRQARTPCPKPITVGRTHSRLAEARLGLPGSAATARRDAALLQHSHFQGKTRGGKNTSRTSDMQIAQSVCSRDHSLKSSP